MIRSLTTAVSGLRSHQTKMDVIGNNIANVNTVAFKSGRVRFEELLSQLIQGATEPMERGGVNPVQIGMGMRTSTISNDFAQGAVKSTGRETDLAIEGDGFFVVNDGVQNFYTRDGSFSRDAHGYLVNINGLRLMGEVAGQEGLQPLHIPLGEDMVAHATSNIVFSGNLDARTEINTVLPPAGLDPADPANWHPPHHIYETSVFDSLGRAYRVEIAFNKTAVAPSGTPPVEQTTWSYGIRVTAPDGVTITPDPPTVGATGTLVFGPDGALDSAASTIAELTFTPDGAEPVSIALDFTETVQLAGASNLMERSQDGFSAGELVSFSIGRDGTVVGLYTNGMVAEKAEIQLAFFVNPGGLLKEGGNLFRISPNSGDARVGAPGTGGRGMLRSSSLEMSNTDLSLEMTEMIVASRAFQANTRVITASDGILMEVINIIR